MVGWGNQKTHSKDPQETRLAGVLKADYCDVHLCGPEYPEEPVPEPGEEAGHLCLCFARSTRDGIKVITLGYGRSGEFVSASKRHDGIDAVYQYCGEVVSTVKG